MKPVTEMTNDEIFAEMQVVGNQMDLHFKENQLHERNSLVPRWRELHRAYDWGFKLHERIETIAWHGRWEEAVITEYDDVMNIFYVRNDKGWEVGVPGRLIRKIIEKVEIKILPPDPVEQFEQLDLFSV